MTYTVQSGDTLSGIARTYNTTVAALMAVNPSITDANKIRVGQQITLPDAGGQASQANQASQGGGVQGGGKQTGDVSTSADATSSSSSSSSTSSSGQGSNGSNGIREINQAGLNLIKQYEGLVDGDKSTVNYDAYMDPVGIWTIGYGHAIVYQGKFLKGAENTALARQLYPGGITLQQAEDLLRADVLNTCRDVQSVVRVPLNDNQFAALVSFTYNLGIGNLKNSTLLKKLNAGDYAGAAAEFPKWNKAGGQVLAGLTKRRAAEQALFLQPV